MPSKQSSVVTKKRLLCRTMFCGIISFKHDLSAIKEIQKKKKAKPKANMSQKSEGGVCGPALLLFTNQPVLRV